MMTRTSLLAVFGASVLMLVACDDGPTSMRSIGRPLDDTRLVVDDARHHIVVFGAENVPVDFELRVSRLGGWVESSLPAIGVATVAGLSDAAVAELRSAVDVQAAERNEVLTIEGADAPDVAESNNLSPEAQPDATAAFMEAASTPQTTAQFYARQWNMRAIFADQAWGAGHLGSSDVVVAIVDSGIDYLHPDFVGLVDLSRSISFVPEDEPIIAARFPGRLSITDLSYHGTAVASIIANNGTLLAGVNRHVTFIAVKSLNRSLEGPVDRMLRGIVYAADQGADVINVSGSRVFSKRAQPGTVAAFQRAVNYAFRMGALVVSGSGNDAADLDHDGDQARLPCQAANTICTSATGPASAAGLNGPWQDVDARAPYSGFGRSTVSVASPGGAGNVGSGRRLWVLCSKTTTESLAPACLAGQPIAQPAASSFAVPHLAGLAALLVARHGHGNPALIRQLILNTADDLGDPGVDPLYGRGRINVARALEVIR